MVINCLPLHQNKVTDPICCPANVNKLSMPQVRAKPAPSPWAAKLAALCWCSTDRESLASKCGLREDGTSGNCTLGRTAGHKCRSSTSYTIKRERFPSSASSSFQSFGGAAAHWPKREVPTQELEWLEALLLHWKRALTTWCTAGQLEEQECSGRTHFLDKTPSGQRILMISWVGIGRVLLQKAPLTPQHTHKRMGFTGGLVELPKTAASQRLPSSQPTVWHVVTVPSAAAPWPHNTDIFGALLWDCGLVSVHLARTQGMEFWAVLWACITVGQVTPGPA